jgi:hypothetical protein
MRKYISPMDYIEASFYQPVLVDMAISPLSPQAFSYYKFKYLGASLQGILRSIRSLSFRNGKASNSFQGQFTSLKISGVFKAST